jgi:hypothetical protein
LLWAGARSAYRLEVSTWRLRRANNTNVLNVTQSARKQQQHRSVTYCYKLN